jgi:hypothetical protein
VQQAGHLRAEVDKDAEVGEAVDTTAVEPAGDELFGTRATKVEPDVLFVGVPIHYTSRCSPG